MGSFRGDVAYAFRQMRRQPLLTGVVVAILALGLGVNTAIVSVAEAILFKSLPVQEPDRLVLFQWTSGPSPRVEYLTGEFWRDRATGRVGAQSFPYAIYQQFTQRDRSLSQVFASAAYGRANVIVGALSDVADVGLVSGNYYAALGVEARLGRLLTPADDRPGGELVAVLSHAYWQRQFGGDPAVIGRAGSLDGHPFRIVGVTEARFHGTGALGSAPQLQIPLAAQASLKPREAFLSNPHWYWLQVMGRLRPGATREQALAELRTVLAPTGESGDQPALDLLPGDRGPVRSRLAYAEPLLVLGLTSGLVLLLACSSVAGVLLARASAQTRETGIRVVLGATRLRLVRQFLTESLLLAAIGAGLGLLLAQWTKDLLANGLLADAAVQVELDRIVLLVALGLAVATGLLAGLLPALRVTSIDSIRERRTWLRRDLRLRPEQALVVLQVAASLTLVTGALLLLRTLHNVASLDTGFAPRGLVLFKVQAELPEGSDLSRRLLERFGRVPGVDAVGVSDHQLLNDNTDQGEVAIDGQAGQPSARDAYMNRAGGEFFRAMGIAMRAGRAIGPQDDARAPGVAVVNEAFVRDLLDGGDPIGRRVNGRSIVGVAADTVYGDLRQPAPPTLFVPAQQAAANPLSFQLRTSVPATALMSEIRRAVRDVDPEAVAYELTTPAEQVERAIAQERLLAGVAALFSALAVLLASLGLYGLTAYAVSRRGREIALRMAVGASTRDIWWLVLRQGVLLAAIGIAGGLVAAALLGRTIERVLYGVRAFDPSSLAAACVLMAAATLIACWVPGRRALRTDPAGVLKSTD